MNQPDIANLIAKRVSAARLTNDALRSVHLKLLRNAADTGHLSMSNRDSAIGEAALLAAATREVEKRRSSDCTLFMTLIRRSRCEVWIEHNRLVRELERLLLMKASRNIDDDEAD